MQACCASTILPHGVLGCICKYQCVSPSPSLSQKFAEYFGLPQTPKATLDWLDARSGGSGALKNKNALHARQVVENKVKTPKALNQLADRIEKADINLGWEVSLRLDLKDQKKAFHNALKVMYQFVLVVSVLCVCQSLVRSSAS